MPTDDRNRNRGDEDDGHFTMHRQTRALVLALTTLKDGETISFEDLAILASVPVDDIRKRRLWSAKKIIERDHHILIETISGIGVRRLHQDAVVIPIEKRRVRVRGAAIRIVNTIRDGITNFDDLPKDVKTTVWATRAVAGAVLLVSSPRSERKLKKCTEIENGGIRVGRTFELLTKK